MTCNPSSIIENSVNIVTYNATLSGGVQTQLGQTVTCVLSNGDYVTINSKSNQGTYQKTYAQDSDPYIDASTISVSISSVSEAGGNFESLLTDGTTADVEITDVVNTTTLTVSVDKTSTTEAGGETLIYTVTLSPNTHIVTDSALVLPLSNGLNITIPVNDYTATGSTVDVADEDVYFDPTTISVTIISGSVVGGNFEDLVISTTSAEYEQQDTMDTVTIFLSCDKEKFVIDTPGDVVFTATLKDGSGNVVVNQGGSTIVVNLEYDNSGNPNSAQISILDSASSGSVIRSFSQPQVYGDIIAVATINNIVGGTGQKHDFEDLAIDSDPSTNVISILGYDTPKFVSADFDYSTSIITVTGYNFQIADVGLGNIDCTKFEVTCESSTKFLLTGGKLAVVDDNSLTLQVENMDKVHVRSILNKNGATSDADSTPYTIIATGSWVTWTDPTHGVDIVDVDASVTVSAYTAPTITGNVDYNYGSGIFTLTGTYFARKECADDIDVTKIALTGENGVSSKYTLVSSSNVEITSETQIQFTLDNAADKFEVNSVLDKDGTVSDDTTTYAFEVAEGFLTAAPTVSQNDYPYCRNICWWLCGTSN